VFYCAEVKVYTKTREKHDKNMKKHVFLGLFFGLTLGFYGDFAPKKGTKRELL
jgi:hypothetical protein